MRIPPLASLVLLALVGCGGHGGSSSGSNSGTTAAGLAGSYSGGATYDAVAGGTATNSSLAAFGTLQAQSGADEFALSVARVSVTDVDSVSGSFDPATGKIAVALVSLFGSSDPLTGTGTGVVKDGVLTLTIDFEDVQSAGAASRYVLVLKKG